MTRNTPLEEMYQRPLGHEHSSGCAPVTGLDAHVAAKDHFIAVGLSTFVSLVHLYRKYVCGFLLARNAVALQ